MTPGSSASGQSDDAEQSASDPLAAIRTLRSASGDTATLLVLSNFHRFLNSAEIVQALAEQLVAGKQTRTFIVVLSPVVAIPVELEKLFVVVEHQLPGREQLHEIATGIAAEDGELTSWRRTRHRAGCRLRADAVRGRERFQSVAGQTQPHHQRSRVGTEVRDAQEVWDCWSCIVVRTTFEALGGLNSLKSFCKRSLLQPGRGNPLKRPRGVLLLGVPGTGKSAFAKALGRETGRPTLILDVGAMMGSLVGQTENNIRQALRIADAMAPCILFVDEIEKGLSGVASSGQTDSGVSARLFSSLLTWLNDHTSDVYFIATSNDISKLPPEFSRSERFDGIFFLDLPTDAEKAAIWQLYLQQFELDGDQPLPSDDKWTGAEIRSCCRLAALLDIPLTQAARNIVPVAVTAAESVDRLRNWSNGRCLSAHENGIYACEPVSQEPVVGDR